MPPDMSGMSVSTAVGNRQSIHSANRARKCGFRTNLFDPIYTIRAVSTDSKNSEPFSSRAIGCNLRKRTKYEHKFSNTNSGTHL